MSERENENKKTELCVVGKTIKSADRRRFTLPS